MCLCINVHVFLFVCLFEARKTDVPTRAQTQAQTQHKHTHVRTDTVKNHPQKQLHVCACTHLCIFLLSNFSVVNIQPSLRLILCRRCSCILHSPGTGGGLVRDARPQHGLQLAALPGRHRWGASVCGTEKPHLPAHGVYVVNPAFGL